MTTPEKIKCVYRMMADDPKSTTFRNPNSELQKCLKCTGYDENCRYYQDTVRFQGFITKLREEHKKETEKKEEGGCAYYSFWSGG